MFWGLKRLRNAMGCCNPIYSKVQQKGTLHPYRYNRLMSRSNTNPSSAVPAEPLHPFHHARFAYSTVTDLAKFLGKSTFKPSATASQ